MIEPETERERAWRLFPVDAQQVLEPRESPSTRCRQPLCRAPVWFGVTRANKRACPFDIRPDGSRTGTSHWRTCRQRPGKR